MEDYPELQPFGENTLHSHWRDNPKINPKLLTDQKGGSVKPEEKELVLSLLAPSVSMDSICKRLNRAEEERRAAAPAGAAASERWMRTPNFVKNLVSNTTLWESWQKGWTAEETLRHIRKVLTQRAENVPEMLDEAFLSGKEVTNVMLGAVICQRVQGDAAPTNQACRATRSEAIGRILAVQAAARAPSGRKRKATPEEETYRTIMEAEPWAPKRAKK